MTKNIATASLDQRLIGPTTTLGHKPAIRSNSQVKMFLPSILILCYSHVSLESRKILKSVSILAGDQGDRGYANSGAISCLRGVISSGFWKLLYEQLVLFEHFFFQELMSNISSLMANLRFTDEDLEGMDALQFEDNHHVEGLDKWIVGKGDLPEFQFGPWLKVDSAQPKITTVRRSRTRIVITKKDVGFANQPIPENNGNNVKEGQEEMTPQMALTSVEAVGQPHQES
ncbi:hypothetical protein V6N11_029029 [Hibiscus sabdariffa]|uniref:Uncharacterized protein n=1 Tax=Hibiscus sabdariffa TaxID=183260 RepID=A0ABR2NWA3_9ROSI